MWKYENHYEEKLLELFHFFRNIDTFSSSQMKKEHFQENAIHLCKSAIQFSFISKNYNNQSLGPFDTQMYLPKL